MNNTICLDTGCVFGGALTALRYPTGELVQVPAEKEWFAPVRPLAGVSEREPSVLDIDDVAGTRWMETTHAGKGPAGRGPVWARGENCPSRRTRTDV